MRRRVKLPSLVKPAPAAVLDDGADHSNTEAGASRAASASQTVAAASSANAQPAAGGGSYGSWEAAKKAAAGDAHEPSVTKRRKIVMLPRFVQPSAPVAAPAAETTAVADPKAGPEVASLADASGSPPSEPAIQSKTSDAGSAADPAAVGHAAGGVGTAQALQHAAADVLVHPASDAGTMPQTQQQWQGRGQGGLDRANDVVPAADLLEATAATALPAFIEGTKSVRKPIGGMAGHPDLKAGAKASAAKLHAKQPVAITAADKHLVEANAPVEASAAKPPRKQHVVKAPGETPGKTVKPAGKLPAATAIGKAPATAARPAGRQAPGKAQSAAAGKAAARQLPGKSAAAAPAPPLKRPQRLPAVLTSTLTSLSSISTGSQTPSTEIVIGKLPRVPVSSGPLPGLMSQGRMQVLAEQLLPARMQPLPIARSALPQSAGAAVLLPCAAEECAIQRCLGSDLPEPAAAPPCSIMRDTVQAKPLMTAPTAPRHRSSIALPLPAASMQWTQEVKLFPTDDLPLPTTLLQKLCV